MAAGNPGPFGDFRPIFASPPWAHWLFAIEPPRPDLASNPGLSWFGVGDIGLKQGLGEGAAAWTGANAAAAVTGFAQGALAKTGGDHPDVTEWYGWILQNVVIPNAGIFGRLVAYGEVLVGIALILGVLTGIAAFFGIVMNANYLLAGTVSSNPILIILGTLLVLAWRNAGWIGLDRWLLPAVGTPWQRGEVFRRRDEGVS